MNIKLTFNYIQRIDKRLAMLNNIGIQIPCLPSDDSLTLKMEKLLLDRKFKIVFRQQ